MKFDKAEFELTDKGVPMQVRFELLKTRERRYRIKVYRYGCRGWIEWRSEKAPPSQANAVKYARWAKDDLLKAKK